MPPDPGASVVEVVVLVRDAGLASSLELALQASCMRVVVQGPETSLPSLALSGETILIIDRSLLPSQAAGAIAALRRGGWRGLAVLLTEDGVCEPSAGDPIAVLEKPFSIAQLTAIIARGPRGKTAG